MALPSLLIYTLQDTFFISFFFYQPLPLIPIPPSLLPSLYLNRPSAPVTRASALLSAEQRADRAGAAERAAAAAATTAVSATVVTAVSATATASVTAATASASTPAVTASSGAPSDRWRYQSATPPNNNNNNNNNNSSLPSGAGSGAVAVAGSSGGVSSEEEFRGKCVDLLKGASSFREHVRQPTHREPTQPPTH